MMQRAKLEYIVMGIFLVIFGFLICDMIEKQQQQTARLRALRKRLQNSNGLETDFEELRKDWQNVQSDLRKAGQKVIADVQQ